MFLCFRRLPHCCYIVLSERSRLVKNKNLCKVLSGSCPRGGNKERYSHDNTGGSTAERQAYRYDRRPLFVRSVARAVAVCPRRPSLLCGLSTAAALLTVYRQAAAISRRPRICSGRLAKVRARRIIHLRPLGSGRPCGSMRRGNIAEPLRGGRG
jgi:hypothetical protein